MTAATVKARMSAPFLLLAGVTLALASWGYFELFTQNAAMPPQLAVVVVAGIDLTAIAFGAHALDVATDGDSSAFWNAMLVLVTAVGAYAQYEHASLAGDPVAVGIVSAVFPVATVLLFEGQLRRVYRLNGRMTGRLSAPRATVDAITWAFDPSLAFRATRLGALDRGLDSNSALIIAEQQLAIEEQTRSTPVERVQLQRTYTQELSTPATAVRTKKPTVADTVRDALEQVGDKKEDVLHFVRTVHPDVPEDTVRVSYNRAKANGTAR